jgi:outer membrane protein OmpA-like peptidoglycan-associated protein
MIFFYKFAPAKKKISNMRKLCIAIGIIVCGITGVMAQQKGSHITISGGLGLSGLDYRYALYKDSYDNGTVKKDIGGNFTVLYSYFFNRHIGLSTGLGFSSFRTNSYYNYPFSDKYYSLGTQVDRTDAANPRNFDLRVRLAYWEEVQSVQTFDVPILFNIQHKFGQNQRHGIFANVGLRFMFPAKTTYAIGEAEAKWTGMRINVSGAYETEEPGVYNAEETGRYVYYNTKEPKEGGNYTYESKEIDPTQPYHGFGASSKPYKDNKMSGRTGTIKLRTGVAFVGEAGVMFGLSSRIDLLLSAYIDYGVNDMKASKSTALLKVSDSGFSPAEDKQVGDGITYLGLLNSDAVSSVKLLSYGGKVGLKIKLGKLQPLGQGTKKISEKTKKTKNQEDKKIEMPVVIYIEDTTCLANNDSLVRHVEELEKRIHQLSTAPMSMVGSTLIQGYIKDVETGQPIAAVIEVTNPKTRKVLTTIASDPATGLFSVSLPVGTDYFLSVNTKGYIYRSEVLKVSKDSESKVMNKDLMMDKITLNKSFTLDYIFFDTDKATLKNSSLVEIEKIYNFLVENPTVEIEVVGHADNTGNPYYNRRLSLKRATAVVNELVRRGISSSRLLVVGRGSDDPAAENNSETGRAMNRRTEIKIIKH